MLKATGCAFWSTGYILGFLDSIHLPHSVLLMPPAGFTVQIWLVKLWVASDQLGLQLFASRRGVGPRVTNLPWSFLSPGPDTDSLLAYQKETPSKFQGLLRVNVLGNRKKTFLISGFPFNPRFWEAKGIMALDNLCSSKDKINRSGVDFDWWQEVQCLSSSMSCCRVLSSLCISSAGRVLVACGSLSDTVHLGFSTEIETGQSPGSLPFQPLLYSG